jgi:hypothetical protein
LLAKDVSNLIQQLFTGISPYAVFAFERMPENYSPVPFDNTTGESIYEEISESVGETNRITTEEHVYEDIT